MIVLKSPREIAKIRAAGEIVAQALRNAAARIEPGVRTRDLDAAIEATFQQSAAEPLFKGIAGRVPFPAASCISVNDEVVHGIPGDRRLQAGDLVSIDTGCRLAGWCADSAWTFPVGPVGEREQRLLECGRRALFRAIEQCGSKTRWSEVVPVIEAEARQNGFSIVESFVGHGIGRELHEDPQVPNFLSRSLKNNDFELRLGLVMAIEPIVNAGSQATRVSPADHWTVSTVDGQPSIHFEHTVALTLDGPVVLTGNGFDQHAAGRACQAHRENFVPG